MKSITFQIDDTGKVLIFPIDSTGDMLAEDQKFNYAELELVGECLWNIKRYPMFYGITAKEFNGKSVDQELADKTQEFKELLNKDEKEVEPVANFNQSAGTFKIKTAEGNELELENPTD